MVLKIVEDELHSFKVTYSDSPKRSSYTDKTSQNKLFKKDSRNTPKSIESNLPKFLFVIIELDKFIILFEISTIIFT